MLNDEGKKPQRVLGRQLTRELTQSEISEVSGADGAATSAASSNTKYLGDNGGGGTGNTWTGETRDDYTA